MAATTSSHSTLIRPAVADEPSIVMWSNNKWLGTMKALGMRDMRAVGDTAFRFKVLRGTGNSSAETFVEGQSLPAVGEQSWVEAALSWIYFRFVVNVSGHLADAMGSHYLSNSALGESAMAGEVKYGLMNLIDIMNTTFLGTGASGLELAVDSAGTYGGLSRSTYSDWGSNENALSGALTVAEMTARVEAIRDNDIGGDFQAAVMPLNQITNYVSLVGPENSTAGARLVRYTAAPGTGPHVDVGWSDSGVTLMGKPCLGIPDMTDTVICYLSNIAEDWQFVTIRPIEEKALSINDDSVARLQVSTGGTLVCRNPRRQAKSTGVTA